MIKKLLISLSAVAAGVFMLVPSMAYGQSLFGNSANEACAGATATENGTCDVNQAKKVDSALKTAVSIFSVIVGIITVIMFVISGARFITSGGDPNNVAKARQSLLYAIVGLIIVAMAQVMIRFVFSRVSQSGNTTTACPDANGDGINDDTGATC